MNSPLSRRQSEQNFFDAQVYSDRPLSPETVERYQYCRHPHTRAEAVYVALGDLRGKSVLEIGCGDGRNSMIMALLGASVTAVDISSRAIAAARSRARNQGVSVQFHEMS